MQVCVCVCARACLPRSTQEVSGESLPVELRLELPFPADSFYANTKPSTTHTHSHSHRRPRQEQPRRPEKKGGCSFPLFLCMFISVSRLPLSASSSRTQTLTSSLSVYTALIALRIQSCGYTLSSSDACQQARYFATSNKLFSIEL